MIGHGFRSGSAGNSNGRPCEWRFLAFGAGGEGARGEGTETKERGPSGGAPPTRPPAFLNRRHRLRERYTPQPSHRFPHRLLAFVASPRRARSICKTRTEDRLPCRPGRAGGAGGLLMLGGRRRHQLIRTKATGPAATRKRSERPHADWTRPIPSQTPPQHSDRPQIYAQAAFLVCRAVVGMARPMGWGPNQTGGRREKSTHPTQTDPTRITPPHTTQAGQLSMPLCR